MFRTYGAAYDSGFGCVVLILACFTGHQRHLAITLSLICDLSQICYYGFTARGFTISFDNMLANDTTTDEGQLEIVP
jgi:hypothetical protein